MELSLFAGFHTFSTFVFVSFKNFVLNFRINNIFIFECINFDKFVSKKLKFKI